MSGDGWKKPLYQVAGQDSRNLADIFNKVGFQWGEDEAKHNVENPGRAIGKAAAYAIGGYLGGAYGGLYDAAGTAGSTAAAGALDESAGLAMGNAFADQAATNASLLAPQGAANTMESGLLDTGYTPSSIQMAFKNASAANGTPLTSNLANYGKQAVSNVMSGGGGGTSSQKAMLMQQGMGLLNPPQQQRPMQAPPPQQAPQGPLPQPYTNSLMMDEERKRRLRAMGYRV